VDTVLGAGRWDTVCAWEIYPRLLFQREMSVWFAGMVGAGSGYIEGAFFLSVSPLSGASLPPHLLRFVGLFLGSAFV
jgi:hypothetical protein